MGEFAYLSEVRAHPWEINRYNLAMAGLPVLPGQKLPNGSILIAETVIRKYDYRRDSIVLCVQDNRVTPFVTWVRTLVSDSPQATGGYTIRDYCESGDYYHTKDVAEAVKKYEKRVSDKMVVLGMSEERT